MASGLSFETELRNFWRDVGCHVRYSEDADRYGKTDAVIDSIGHPLPRPIVIQVTTNVDQPIKQKDFEIYLLDQKNSCAVYLEVDPLAFERVRLNSDEGYNIVYQIAQKTVKIFLKIEEILRELGSHLICLRVDRNLNCRCFDLSLHWRLLYSWRAEQLKSTNRRQGAIVKFWNGSYGLIKSSVGGKEEIRRIHISNIRDKGLRERLIGKSAPPLRGRINIPVTFLPAELDSGPPDIGPVEYEDPTALAVRSM